MRILFLTTIPSPYRVNFFNELGKQCELTVLFEKEFSTERSEEWKNYKIKNFKAEFLHGYSVKANKAFCPQIIKAYKRIPHDVLIIGGYNTPTAMYLISYLRRHNHPFILSADGGVLKSESKLAYMVKKHFISSAKMWIGTSDGTEEFFCHYGAQKEKVRKYPFTSIYKEQILSAPVTEQEKSEIRSKLGLAEQYTVVGVGQFIYRKGFDVLLKAAASLPQDIAYYIIGGEPTEEYRKLIEENKLENIHFLPFMNSTELLKYYKASDLFVLPTREDIWGLVINEAAACGLPIVTTQQCVAGKEIIEKYKNGLLVEKDDINGLTEAILAIYQDKHMQTVMASQSLEAAYAYTFENMADVHMKIAREFLK